MGIELGGFGLGLASSSAEQPRPLFRNCGSELSRGKVLEYQSPSQLLPYQDLLVAEI